MKRMLHGFMQNHAGLKNRSWTELNGFRVFRVTLKTLKTLNPKPWGRGVRGGGTG